MRAVRIEVQVGVGMDADQLAELVTSMSALLATYTRAKHSQTRARATRKPRKAGGRS